MITVAKKGLVGPSCGISPAANIIRKAKRLTISRGHIYYQSRKLDRVPREVMEELLGINFTNRSS